MLIFNVYVILIATCLYKLGHEKGMVPYVIMTYFLAFRLIHDLAKNIFLTCMNRCLDACSIQIARNVEHVDDHDVYFMQHFIQDFQKEGETICYPSPPRKQCPMF